MKIKSGHKNEENAKEGRAGGLLLSGWSSYPERLLSRLW